MGSNSIWCPLLATGGTWSEECGAPSKGDPLSMMSGIWLFFALCHMVNYVLCFTSQCSIV